MGARHGRAGPTPLSPLPPPFSLQERRTQLFSATMTSKVAKLQRACLQNPVKVRGGGAGWA